jgi:predicted GIY-YIG superfamily endonuclease
VTTLYRHFDAVDRLLYVGISDGIKKRLAQHERTAWWWPLVKRITLDHFDSREEAAAAEVLAITTERPHCNQRRRKNTKPAERLRLAVPR